MAQLAVELRTFMCSSSGELPMPTMMMDMGSVEAETMVSTVSCAQDRKGRQRS